MIIKYPRGLEIELSKIVGFSFETELIPEFMKLLNKKENQKGGK